MGTVQLRDRS